MKTTKNSRNKTYLLRTIVKVNETQKIERSPLYIPYTDRDIKWNIQF